MNRVGSPTRVLGLWMPGFSCIGSGFAGADAGDIALCFGR